MVNLHIRRFGFAGLILLLLAGCQKKEVLQQEDPDPVDPPLVEACPGCEFPENTWPSSSTGNPLIFRFRTDSTLPRLNAAGALSPLAPGNGGQSPLAFSLAAEYIELMPEANTLPGQGVLLYAAPQSSCGGSAATNYCKLRLVQDSAVLCAVDLHAIPPGTYKWIRVAVASAAYTIRSRTNSTGNILGDFSAFYAEQCYLTKIRMSNTVLTPSLGASGNKSRGYYVFGQNVFGQYLAFDAYAPSTTVVNGNTAQADTRFMYAEFTNASGTAANPLQISGTENSKHEIELIFGSKACFEWKEVTKDGIFQPEIGEFVLDFGFRNLQARH